MIYAKIYVDKDGNLIFDSVREHAKFRLVLANQPLYRGKSVTYYPRTIVKSTKYVVCSREARELFLSLLQSDNPNLSFDKYTGDFEMYQQGIPISEYDKNYAFSFKPNDASDTKRVLMPSDPFVVCTDYGLVYEVLDDFIFADNAFIEALDLEKPVDEAAIPKEIKG